LGVRNGVPPFGADHVRGGRLAAPQKAIVTVAIFTFYLVTTAWATVRRKEGGIGLFEKPACPVALGAAEFLLILGLQADTSPTGRLDGAPPLRYYVFASFAAFAAGGDLNVILRGGVSGAQRTARHLWRMCLALFFATSFFLPRTTEADAHVHPGIACSFGRRDRASANDGLLAGARSPDRRLQAPGDRIADEWFCRFSCKPAYFGVEAPMRRSGVPTLATSEPGAIRSTRLSRGAEGAGPDGGTALLCHSSIVA